MKDAVHFVLWLFLGALVVLIVTHADGFAKAVTAVGGQVNSSAALLAGYPPPGPQRAATTVGYAATPASFQLRAA